MHWMRIVGFRGVLMLLVSGPMGCADGGEGFSAELRSTASEIVGGTNLSEAAVQSLGLTAVYHWHDGVGGIWPRPCSGTIIRSDGYVSKVLTARHCITRDLKEGGTPLKNYEVWFAPAAAPGPATNGAVPGGAYPAASIAAQPYVSNVYDDLAIVTVIGASWADRVAKAGFFVGDPAALNGKQVTAYGYGINVDDTTCLGNPASIVGAGIARKGGPFTIDGAAAGAHGDGSIGYANPNSTGKKVMCGDSGGPDLMAYGWGSTWRSLIAGVHGKQVAATLFGPTPSLWVVQTLGGLYVASYSDPLGTYVLGADGNAVIPVLKTDGRRLQMIYDRTTGRITAAGKCLSYGPYNPPSNMTVGAMLATCTGTVGTGYQKWEITGEMQIKSTYGQCLKFGWPVTLQTCASQDGTQAWLWRAQP